MTPEVYVVGFFRSARKGLDNLDTAAARRITPAIDALAVDPRPPGCLKVRTEEGVWRIRIGDYRVAYEIDDEARTITVIRVGHRRDFYD